MGDGGPRLLLSEKEREGGGCRRVRGGEKEDRLKVETGGAPCSLEDAALTRGSAAALSDPSASSPTDRNIQRHFPPPPTTHPHSPSDRLCSPCRRPSARSGICSASPSRRCCGSGCCGTPSQREVRSGSGCVLVQCFGVSAGRLVRSGGGGGSSSAFSPRINNSSFWASLSCLGSRGRRKTERVRSGVVVCVCACPCVFY